MFYTDSGMFVDYKSDEKSIKFREKGNTEFIKKNYLDALNSYNKSIAYATSKEVLSLGYANRSAVYMEIECYEECLKNIEWARENDYPMDKIEKLNERELKCKRFIQEGKKNLVEDPWNFFKLSYPANKKIPWIVDRLELRTTEKYGRGIYATQDLKAGDIICVEELIIHSLSNESRYKHCDNCLKTSLLNLLPCSRTSTTMFCSTDCQEDLYSKSINYMQAMEDDMKILSEVAVPFGGYKELDDFIKKKDLKDLKKTIFDYDLSDPEDPDYRKKLMLCFLSLQARHGFKVPEATCEIFKYVSKKTARLILNLQISNMKKVSYREMKYLYHDGTQVSLFQSLVNHSCDNNVNFISIDNKNVAFVIRPIKAGEQVFDSYFNKYYTEYSKNKNEMMEHFKFKCDCQICVHNSFKQYSVSPTCIPLPNMIMSRKDFSRAKEILKNCWHTLNTSKNPRDLFTSEFQSHEIMMTLAYYASYPCQKSI
jgi:tetratricopeptide (TPR) repeat protein